MLAANVLKMLSLAGLKAKAGQGDRDWVTSECPFAPWTHERGSDRNPSFGIKTSPGPSNYHCFSCGQKGSLMYLPNALSKHSSAVGILKILSDYILRYDVSEFSADLYPDYGSEKIFRVPDTSVWPESYLEDFPPVIGHINALSYLSKRGVTARVIRQLGLRYDPQKRRVCFPCRNAEGELVGLHGRAIDSENPLRYYAYKYGDTYNNHVWTNTNNIDCSNPLILVESVFDLASVLRVYSNVVCSRSASVSNDLMLTLPLCPYIITLYDSDSAGDAARLFITSKSNSPVTHLLPVEGKKDPGEMTEEEVSSLLTESLFSTI